ncbi:MAG: curli production assembly protein CsgF [Pseudomonas sp.]|uniref:Curli production assembly/transport component CsgF n=1 Tax=Stutzerimonas chloritidismutans TaxID=203192 RepID=A0ABU9M4R7_STUCH|nr:MULTISPECIES: curli assembly protein CsgF [Pseudomonadaceae]MAX91646.1 curli production assembly protein CsgF [Pseudomonas sp.]MBK60405.1 curli production assembly protein CsgF [Pseudomonas sp.]MCQ4277810.1 curli assembly protein CsgF [Stutzerimonas stutzeri]PNF73618.1 curli production assembly protein CsgF [Stutzerimonas stutzeri]VXC87485.1 putative transport/assembly protein for curli synthesis [Pseudomonas sp. 9Ag]|tara:strand:+ start:95092 stop:95502 length:411 start_codon:yes stop_codon:yes gene_type:complete
MNRPQQKITGVFLAGLLLSSGLSATELVYTPVNPSFGGSPLNGAWLLGSAQAQNDKKDPDAIDRSIYERPSDLERLTSQLESSLLSELLRDAQAGETGSLTTTDFFVRAYNGDAGLLIVEITDRVTGEISEIIIGQ